VHASEIQDSFQSDKAITDVIRSRLHVAVVSDILDAVGYRHQAMHQRLRPLLPDRTACGFVGRARTCFWTETDSVREDDPYGLEIEAMDSFGRGDVIVHSTDAHGRSAPWGELMTTVAMRNGVVGCVCDSNVRDCLRIIDMGFPVYCAGIKPVDSKGRGIVTAYDVPVECGGVIVRPGELIFADYDGIVAIPTEVEQQVIALALEKLGQENATRRELEQGQTLRYAYNKYGVL